MRILFLAPQPFFQERGTPIAVRLACEVLAKRVGDSIDLLTYHEGADLSIPNVELHRIEMPRWLRIRGVGPGISFKKLLCDVLFFFKAWKMISSAGQRPYELVHAVEEAVFMAWIFRKFFGIPYLYDMDSSLAVQLTEKWFLLRPFLKLFEALERAVVRGSVAVVPVCDALAAVADRHGSVLTRVLSDISLLDQSPRNGEINLRAELGVASGTEVVLYIGNLESYQGIDLLVESFEFVSRAHPHAVLAVIGGREDHVAQYVEKSRFLGLASCVRFLGPRPVASLNDYLLQATVLVSPRTKGNNTPMKVYSYLHAGVPLVATNLPTHTQVLTEEVAVLADAEPAAFAAGISRVLSDQLHARRIGAAARALAESRYTFGHFERTLTSLYDQIAGQVSCSPETLLSPPRRALKE